MIQVKKVCGRRLLIQKDKVDFERKSKGGIYIEPAIDSYLKNLASSTGTVLQIGPEAWNDYEEPFCQVGDRVAFAQYAGALVDSKNPDSLVYINDIDVIATLESEDNDSE
jgi:co-chaperonin GroES (HSP10)